MQRKVPSAITNITLNRATFTDVPIDELTFVNFFYGNNGAGKSSIAHAIAEDDGVVWADGKTADDFDVLVYNQDFINDNFVNYGDLKGVFIFGEEDIEAKKKIAELTDQKKQKMDARQTALDEHKKKTDGLASALTQFQDTCFSKTAEIRRRFDKCMDGKKQKKNFAEAVLGETKPTDHDLAELERLYDVAFDDSARAYTEFKKAAATTYGSLPGKDLLDRILVFNATIPTVKNNVDICLFSSNIDDYDPKTLVRHDERALMFGELKGGIDPAGADEHWKTGNTALNRIRTSFAAAGYPQMMTSFVGAAIERAMAEEIYAQLESGTLTNATNLTNNNQLIEYCNWLIEL